MRTVNEKAHRLMVRSTAEMEKWLSTQVGSLNCNWEDAKQELCVALTEFRSLRDKLEDFFSKEKSTIRMLEDVKLRISTFEIHADVHRHQDPVLALQVGQSRSPVL